MDAAIAAVLRQAALAIGEPDRAAQVERVACEARAGDLAYLSGDDSDDSDDDAWEYAACPDAEQRFEAVESALAYRYTSSTFRDADLDAVAHFAARAAVACGAVGHRGAAARAFLDKEVDRYRRRLHAGAARLAAVDAARARPGERQDDPDLESPEHVAAFLKRPSGAGAIVARRATPAFLNDMTGDRHGVVVFRRVAFFLADGAACRGIAVRRFRRKLAAALRRGALRSAEAVVGISDDPSVAAAERLVRWASAAAAPRPGALLALNSIGDVDEAVAKGRVAPCFVRMHRELRYRGHLKFEASFQYRCLLNALGASVDLVIAIGRERFMSHAESHQPRDQWAENTLKTLQKGYDATGCEKMIDGRTHAIKYTKIGGAHDCPFAHAPDVARLLKDAYGLDDGDVRMILDEAGPRRQCLATFWAVHGADAYDVASVERRLRKARVDASAKEVAGLERELAAARHGTFECPTHWTDRSLAVTK